MTNLRAIFGIAAAAAAGLAHSADTASHGAGDGSLDEIVVVANKAERSLREVAANVTVLTRETLADELSTSLGESFRYTPGIDEEWAGGRFGSEGISIRGIGGNRVALVVDGVKLGDQYDIGSFANATRDFIDAGFIRRAEVLHGPASALYGSDAIGGVVSVRTLLPADLVGPDDDGGTVSALWHGADDSLHGTALAAFGTAVRGIVLGGSRREGGARDSAALSEPVDEREFRRTSALVNVASDDVFGHRASAGLLYQDSAVDTDLHSMLGSGRFAATTALKGFDESRLAVAHADLAIGGAGALVHDGVLRLYAGQSDIDQDTRDVRANAARPVIIDREFEYDQAFH
ncbi:MAG TPA: TonB-dependent receptor plug domain-containing protein, partial [Woeseiaceae bacterium]|nr:TonB-dependent receptor plug domain-containing protein [Woeseiaceae bacterium]